MSGRVPWRTVGLLAAVLLAVLVPFALFGARVDAWVAGLVERAGERPGLTGAVLVGLLMVDIVAPVPSSLVSTACGMTLGFAGGTLASFVGMTATSVAGYLMGRYASGAAERMVGAREMALLREFHRRHGMWLLVALRPVPVLAEASVVFCGLSRHPLGRVAAVTAAGNLAVSAVYAAVGVWGSLSDSFLPAFGASMAVSGVFLVWMRRRGKRVNGEGF